MSDDIARLGLEVQSDDIVKATRRLGNLEKKSKKVESGAKGLSSSFKMLSGAAAALAGSLAIREIISTAAAFEKMEASLVTVTGSTEKATEAMSGITQFATSTPYQVGQITEAFIKLKALGIAPTEENLRSFGNTSAAMGKDLNQMIEAVADAATGEFERLKEFGIKANAQGQDVKFTFQGVTTTVGKNSAEITKYLEGIGNTQFAGAMEKQMNTLDGVFSNFSDSVALAIKKLSEESGFNNLIKEATKGAALFIRELSGTQNISDINDKIEQTRKTIKDFKQEIETAKTEKLGFFGRLLEGDQEGRIQTLNGFISNTEKHLSNLIEQKKKLESSSGGITDAGANTAGPDTASAAAATFDKAGGEKALEKLKNQYADEQQLLTDKYQAEQELLVAKLEADQSFKDQYAALSFEMDKKYAEKSAELTKKEEEKKRFFRMQGVRYAGAIADNLSGLMSSKSKELFEIGKAAATASALINTYQAITLTMATTPYPWNIPLAVAQGIAGMAQVSNIQSQSFGGGGGGSVAVTGGGGAAAGFSGGGAIPGPSPAPSETNAPKQSVNITLNGAGYSRENVRELIGSIKEEIGDGVEFNVT